MGHVMRYDAGPSAGTLRRPRMTSQGFLRVDGHAARAGIYEYRNPDGTKRYELRPVEEVQRADSLASYDGAPVTMEHPHDAAGNPVDVNADNVHKYEIGTVMGSARADGDHVAVDMTIKRKDAIVKVKAGKQELSPGYKIRYDETPGTDKRYAYPGNPEGRYDGVQRDVSINHLAVVERARGGSSIRMRMDAAEVVEDFRYDAVLSAKERHALNADDFAVPDSEGMPIHDEEHVHAAMSRFGQFEFADAAAKKAAYGRIVRRAKKLGVDSSGFAEKWADRLDAADRLTTVTNGHQHMICLEPEYGSRMAGCTSWAKEEGEDGMGHSHDWIRNPDGSVTISENDGHTHGLLSNPVNDYPRLDHKFDRSRTNTQGGHMTTPGNVPQQPTPEEQLRLLTVRLDAAEQTATTTKAELEQSRRDADGMRAELVTARENIETLKAQLAAGAKAVETAAVLEQQQRADSLEQEISDLKRSIPDRIRRRASLESRATAVLGTRIRFDGMTDRDILVTAVKHLKPKDPVGSDVTDAFLESRLDSLIEDRTSNALSYARASQIMAVRTDATPTNARFDAPTQAAKLPWKDTWKQGAGQYATRKDS